MSEQRSYQRSPNGMVGALLVSLAVIAVFVGLRAISRDNTATPVATFPYGPLLKQARADKRLLAPAPDPMPDGWRATSARYVPGSNASWHLGILTAQGKYVGIEESRSPVSDKVSQFLGDAATKGNVTRVGKRRWRAWTLPDGDYALTLRTVTGSVLVGGSAGASMTRRLVDQLSFGTG